MGDFERKHTDCAGKPARINETSDDSGVRTDLDGEEYRDSTFYQPISTKEYLKLLGYCLVGLLVVALLFILVSFFTK